MFQDDIRSAKQRIRERVWSEMEAKGVASFPLPPMGRVPNFKGSELAASRMRELEEYSSADVIMVNPDAPQLPVRRMALLDEKRLLMATPALRAGLVILDPKRMDDPARAATIPGAVKHGKPADLRSVEVDLIVEGSVAVDACGGRVGKGAGWGDLEYAVLRESGAADGSVKVVTTVHDIQMIDDPIPMEPHDMPVDLILTPTKIVRAETGHPRPDGVIWDKLDPAKRDLVRRMLKAQM
ncbi:MAG: 5-formyltetrahydrofolate cyclo-ligase [Candidatus Hadarchaeales archaeon]